MIRTEGLTKVFGNGSASLRAVDALDLSVHEGEVFGFLGPNGAGKTTTVRLLTTLVAATGGRAWVNGLEVGEGNDATIRAKVGILTEAPGLYDRLSAEQNLLIFAALYGCPDPKGSVARYLRLLDLWGRRDSAAGTFSKGMRQKLAIARALVHEPPLVFLDEPTSGLDPEAAKTVCEFIETLRGQGRTIFLCTHNLGEAERLCDRVAVFQQRLVAVDTPDALRQRLFGRQTVVHLAPGSRLQEFARLVGELPGVRAANAEDGVGGDLPRLVIDVGAPEHDNPRIVRALVEHGAEVQFVTELRHSLEEVYLNLIHSAASKAGASR